MSKSYYAAIYLRKKYKPIWYDEMADIDVYQLHEVIRYHDDNLSSGEVKAIRDEEVRLYDYGPYHWVAVRAKDVPRLVRDLYQLKPYERFYGEIKFCEQCYSGSGLSCATIPAYICHG